ncbi:mucin-19-like [Dermacentor albipictus]|uniref:mucin-19-like n=1 Tax=Dermacentor albipictus TaxID=60249 RepID=UPI0038FC1F4C
MWLLQMVCLLLVATLLRSVGTPTRLNPYDDRCRVRFSESEAENCPSVGYFFDSRSRLCKRTCSEEAPFESTSKCVKRCRSVVVCFIPRRRNRCGDVPIVTVYYFDINKGRCLAERGCTYNGNNFPTLGECERTCGVGSQEAGEAPSGAQFGARDNQTWNQPHREPYTTQQAPPVIASSNNASATGSESSSTYTLSPYDLKCRYQEQETVHKNCSSVKHYFDHASRACKTTCNSEAPFKTGWECSWTCRSVIHCFIQRPAVLCAGRQTTTIYYFDIFKGMCFPQQGCSYRGNNFPTLHECQSTCGVYTGTKQQAEVARHTSYAIPSNTRPSTPQLEAPNTVREFTGAGQSNNVAETTGGSESSVRRSTGGRDLTEVSEAGLGHSSALVNAANGNAAGRQHYNMSTESTPGPGISGPYRAAISSSPLDNGEGVTYPRDTTHFTTGNEVHLRNPVNVAGSTGSSASEAGYSNMKPHSTDRSIPGVRPSPHVRHSASSNESVEEAISGARSSPGGARRGNGHANRHSIRAEVNQTDFRHHAGPVTSSAGNREVALSSTDLRSWTGGRGTGGRHYRGEPQPTEESGSGVRNYRGAGRSTIRNETEKAHPETVTGSSSQGDGNESVNSNDVSLTSEGNPASALHHPDVTHSTEGQGSYASLRHSTGGVGREGGSPNTFPQSSEGSAGARGSHPNLSPSTAGNVPEAGRVLGVMGSAGDRTIESGHSSVVPHAPQGSVTGPALNSVSTGASTSGVTGKVYPNINRRPTGSGASAATYPLGLTEAEILKGAATVQQIFAAIHDFIGTLPFNSLRERNRRWTRRKELNSDTP